MYIESFRCSICNPPLLSFCKSEKDKANEADIRKGRIHRRINVL